jgi:hypothetical protein
MTIYKKIKSLDSKFSWSFFGFLIGFLGIAYAIYVEQFKEERPKLVFDLLSNTQVLSVNEDVNKLDIIYDGQNLKAQKKNLILLTIRIKNEGTEGIKEGDYYSKIPFGLKIEGGNIAENPQLIDASDNFLKENVSLSNDSLNNIIINKIPIEENQYFTIKVLTICNQNISPTITPFGKINRMIGEFEIQNSYLSGQKTKKSFFENLTDGSISIHIARFFYYLILIFLVGFLIGFPVSKISKYFERKGKEKIIEKFREKTKIELTDKIDIVFDIYRKENIYYFKWLYKLLSDNEKLVRHLNYFENRNNEDYLIEDFREESPLSNQSYEERIHYITSTNYLISILMHKKVIIKTDKDVTVDEQFKNGFMEFYHFID